jgi:ATP-binding cassette subfamily F protein 3
VVVEATSLSKSYGSLEVLKNIDFIIERGEKIAFVGRNGEGKTTFSRIIVGESDYTGHLKMGLNLKTGYFAQNQDELLDENKTVLQTIDEIAKGEIRTRIRDILGAFLFRGEEIDKKVKVLSGGERSRLALIKLLLEPYNLLVLDEPTNHIDMRSKDILKQALIKYDGTLIVVSHDRDFLNGLVRKVYEFRNNKIKENIGGIYDFLRKKRIENLQELEIKERPAYTSESPSNISDNKRKYIEKKEYDRNLRRLAKRVEDIEAEIEMIEAKMAEMDKILSQPDHMSPPDEGFFTEYNDLKKSLNEKIALWGDSTSELEKFKKSMNNGIASI